MTLGSNLRDVKAQVPRSSGCFDRKRLDCVFVDRFGYENQFSEFLHRETAGDGVSDRFLFRREAHRERGGWLPFGVRWSDTPAKIRERLKAAGVASAAFHHPDVHGVATLGCFAPSEYRIEFEFGSNGRLRKVIQALTWP